MVKCLQQDGHRRAPLAQTPTTLNIFIWTPHTNTQVHKQKLLAPLEEGEASPFSPSPRPTHSAPTGCLGRLLFAFKY